MLKFEGTAPPAVERICDISDKTVRQGALDVLVRSFGSVDSLERALTRGRWRPPIFNPEHTRVVTVRGKAVSAVVMAPRMMRFGPVTIPAMTLGPVGTHPHHRRRGHAAAAMRDASRYMEENGFLLAYLGGVADFYGRFGYYPYIASCSVTFQRENARKHSRSGKLRRMTRADLPHVRKLYDEVTADRLCAAERDDELWDWLIGPGTQADLFSRPCVILNESGGVCGYLTLQPHRSRLNIPEIIVRQDERARRAALGAMVREARRREVKEIQLELPWDDALAVFLRQYVGADFRLESHPTGGPLMKVVNFSALMRRLEPLFTERLRKSRANFSGLAFTLSCELGSVGITMTRRVVRIGRPRRGSRVRAPQRWLSGLLTGYYGVQDVASREGATVPDGALAAMEALFPRAWPHVYRADSY